MYKADCHIFKMKGVGSKVCMGTSPAYSLERIQYSECSLHDMPSLASIPTASFARSTLSCMWTSRSSGAVKQVQQSIRTLLDIIRGTNKDCRIHVYGDYKARTTCQKPSCTIKAVIHSQYTTQYQLGPICRSTIERLRRASFVFLWDSELVKQSWASWTLPLFQ